MLRQAADRRTLLFVATYFGLVALAWLTEPGLLLQAVLFISICCFSWFCAVITHNTIHHPIFHSKRANKLFQIVLTQCYGHPVSTFVAGHNLSHHKHVQEAADVMRTTKLRHRWNLLNLLLFFPTVAPSILRGERQFIAYMRRERPRWYRQFRIEAALLIGVMAALALIDWRKFLAFWWLPHVWAGYGIVTINLLQHDGCNEDDGINHSRNFVGRSLAWWTFNNGFHTIHHMKPSLHWSQTPAAHAELVHPHIHPALEEPSIWGYVWRAYFWPGRRMRFDGTPLELPPPLEDIDWVPRSREVLETASLGAESS